MLPRHASSITSQVHHALHVCASHNCGWYVCVCVCVRRTQLTEFAGLVPNLAEEHIWSQEEMQGAEDAKAVQEHENAEVMQPLTPRPQCASDDFDMMDDFGAPPKGLSLRASRHMRERLHIAKSKKVRNHH